MILIGADMVPSEASRQAFFEGTRKNCSGKNFLRFFRLRIFLSQILKSRCVNLPSR